MTLCITILIGAVVLDLFTYKIPNSFVLLSFLLTILNNIVQTSITNLFQPTFYAVLILLILYPLFLFRILGAGDIKLFAIFPFYFCIQDCMEIFIQALIFAVIMGTIKVIILILIHKKRETKYTYIHFSIPILFSSIFIQFGGTSWIKF